MEFHVPRGQNYALQGLEQVRSAKWDFWTYPITDYLPVPGNVVGGTTNFPPQSDIMDVPMTGSQLTNCFVTNYIKLKQISTSPQLRECVPMRLDFSRSPANYSPTP